MLQVILVSGLVSGGIYALIALGFSLVYSVGRIVNMAQTAFYMLAAYAIYTLLSVLAFNSIIAIFITIVIVAALGVASYKVFIDRIREHEWAVVLITMALGMIFQELMLLIFGGDYHSVTPFVPGGMELLGIRVTHQQLLTTGGCVASFLGILALLYKSRLGLAIRVSAQDREVATLMGIPVSTMGIIVMAISAALAAVAGIVIAAIWVVEPHMWLSPLVMMLAAVILGGLGSTKGALVGAFILGYTQVIVTSLLPMGSFIKEAIALVIMLTVLLVKPEGLWGTVFEQERL